MSSFLPNKPIDESDIDFAWECLNLEQYAEAQFLLQNFLNSGRADALFNIALCGMQLQNYQAAADYFEKALTVLQRANRMDAVKKDDSYIKLRKNEIKNKIYLKPVKKTYMERFPEIAKENAILSFIDACMASGMNDKAKKLSNTLVGEEFSDYKNLM